ncbi:MAG: carbohydrate kinase family protein [Micromonosporaceae bacterium]
MTRGGRVLVVGDVVTDIVAVHPAALAVGSDTAAQISLVAGGAAANTAAWLATLDVAVDLVAAVGADAAGAQRVAELVTAGVGCAGVRRVDGAPTGSIIVLVHAGERSFLCDRGANLALTPSDVEAAVAVAATGHVHLSGYVLLDEQSRPAGLAALAAGAAAGASTSVDAASAAPLRRTPEFLHWIRGTDLLLANVGEAQAMRSAVSSDGDALAAELTAFARAVVVKLGAGGALWADATGVVARVPARPAAVVDPTGAGDAFAAGLLAAWLAGAAPSEALAAGTRLGALAVSQVGARPR